MATLLDNGPTQQPLADAADFLGFDLDWDGAAPPPEEPTLPLAEWVYAQVSLFRSPAKHDEYPQHDDELRMEIVADALADLAIGVRRRGCQTPAEYLATGAFGRFPEGWTLGIPNDRASYLAGALDDEARPYAAMGSDVGLLCAIAVEAVAEDAERLGATSAHDYVKKCEQRDEQRRAELAELLADDPEWN